jgi:hypothetical protein
MLPGDLFFVVVRHRGAVVHPPEPVDRSGIEEERGRELGLACAAVTDECNVANRVRVVDLHGRIVLRGGGSSPHDTAAMRPDSIRRTVATSAARRLCNSSGMNVRSRARSKSYSSSLVEPSE